ncbi:MAG TPA: GDSL-type esterase/lipase family protein [Elusimicrobiota bacterium]|nr:GDSL-type esterase/lipase family protein [Elusimicrobiota bacterium]
MKRGGSSSGRWFGRAALTALSFALGLALAEAALLPTRWSAREIYSRAGGWRHLEYGQAVGRVEKSWTADFRKNSLSLRGAEPVHPAIIALGDSCTAGCFVPERETYAGRLAAGGVEVLNAGIPGFSSYQGAAWVRDSKILDYHPKLVTIYYGWNDHWRAFLPERAFAWLREAAPYSHAASWILLRYERSLWQVDDTSHLFFSRVPLREYKANLRELVREARAAGAVAVLITAPIEPRNGPPVEELRKDGRLPEFLDHEAYVGATREVAAETGAGLVDFAAEYERRKTADAREYFSDFVHPNAKGHALLAGLLRPWAACALAGSCPPRPEYAGR